MKRILFLFIFLLIGLIAVHFFYSTDFWSEHGPGITDRISSSNAVYLTLDACGSTKGKAYDAELITFLRANKVPATLFMNARWIDANPNIFMELANDPLFKIGNHGMEHKPASTIGHEIYGIKGTTSPAALIAEVQDNADKIEKLTGTRPLWFRSGTAYYDTPAIKVKNPRAEPVALNSPLKGGVSRNTGKPLQGYSQSFSLKSNVPWPD